MTETTPEDAALARIRARTLDEICDLDGRRAKLRERMEQAKTAYKEAKEDYDAMVEKLDGLVHDARTRQLRLDDAVDAWLAGEPGEQGPAGEEENLDEH